MADGGAGSSSPIKEKESHGPSSKEDEATDDKWSKDTSLHSLPNYIRNCGEYMIKGDYKTYASLEVELTRGRIKQL